LGTGWGWGLNSGDGDEIHYRVILYYIGNPCIGL